MFQFSDDIQSPSNGDGQLKTLFAEIRRRSEGEQSKGRSERLVELKDGARTLSWKRMVQTSH